MHAHIHARALLAALLLHLHFAVVVHYCTVLCCELRCCLIQAYFEVQYYCC